MRQDKAGERNNNQVINRKYLSKTEQTYLAFLTVLRTD